MICFQALLEKVQCTNPASSNVTHTHPQMEILYFIGEIWGPLRYKNLAVRFKGINGNQWKFLLPLLVSDINFGTD